MENADHERLADQVEQQVDELQDRADNVGEQIKETREEWERKRSADDVPGATPPEGGEDAPEGRSPESA
jgi:hypothetical protein